MRIVLIWVPYVLYNAYFAFIIKVWIKQPKMVGGMRISIGGDFWTIRPRLLGMGSVW